MKGVGQTEAKICGNKYYLRNVIILKLSQFRPNLSENNLWKTERLKESRLIIYQWLYTVIFFFQKLEFLFIYLSMSYQWICRVPVDLIIIGSLFSFLINSVLRQQKFPNDLSVFCYCLHFCVTIFSYIRAYLKGTLTLWDHKSS